MEVLLPCIDFRGRNQIILSSTLVLDILVSKKLLRRVCKLAIRGVKAYWDHQTSGLKQCQRKGTESTMASNKTNSKTGQKLHCCTAMGLSFRATTEWFSIIKEKIFSSGDLKS